MEAKELAARLASIEAQIRVLRAQISTQEEKEKPKSFADLEGIWKGKTNFSYEEIKEAEIKLPEDL